MVNAAGLPNPGAKKFSTELGRIEGKRLPVAVSIFGGDDVEFAKVVRALDGGDFAACEMNLSCPHVAGIGTEIGHFPDAVAKVTMAGRANTKPVFAASQVLGSGRGNCLCESV